MNINNHYEEKLSPGKCIALFTSNFQGGILQYTMNLGVVLSKLNYKVVMFIPDNAKDLNYDSLAIYRYRRYKSMMPHNKFSAKIARMIIDTQPDLVLFCDAAILSSQILLEVSKEYKTILTIHDVKQHPAKFDIYTHAKQVLEEWTLKQALSKANKVILLSKNSKELFSVRYSKYTDKSVWMPLGAHIPEATLQEPPELSGVTQSGYYLFFGRICKYKGLYNLLKAYDSIVGEEKSILVIAGDGKLEAKEMQLINKNRVLLINRFIQDGEMLYLLKNSRTVVLPYTEASQSGVIPIAYSFGIPVIASNIPGLVEYVENGRSGILCSDNQEIRDALLSIRDDDFHSLLSEGAYHYYIEKLNWENNLKKCLNLESEE